MKKYSNNTVYFISYAKLPSNIPAGHAFDNVGIGLVINNITGRVEDTSCTLLTTEARHFLKDLIVGFNFHQDDIEVLLSDLRFRYHGMAQKGICVAIKESYNKYMAWRKENIDRLGKIK